MSSSLITGVNKIKQAIEYFEDFKRQTKGGLGEKKAKLYISKLDWILLDFKTIAAFGDAVRQSIREEIQEDYEDYINQEYERI